MVESNQYRGFRSEQLTVSSRGDKIGIHTRGVTVGNNQNSKNHKPTPLIVDLSPVAKTYFGLLEAKSHLIEIPYSDLICFFEILWSDVISWQLNERLLSRYFYLECRLPSFPVPGTHHLDS